MARGDPILCQDPGDVLQFANQVRYVCRRRSVSTLTKLPLP